MQRQYEQRSVLSDDGRGEVIFNKANSSKIKNLEDEINLLKHENRAKDNEIQRLKNQKFVPRLVSSFWLQGIFVTKGVTYVT